MRTLMRSQTVRLVVITGLLVGFSLALGTQERQRTPPEYKLLNKARRITDPEARLAELERIKSMYPDSKYADQIQRAIVNTKIELSTTFEEILKL